MRRRICLTVLLVLLTAGAASAGRDITGWGKARWGMPLSDVQKLYPGKWYPKDPARWAALEKPEVDGKPFFVMFWFPADSPVAKLNRVTMVTQGKPGDFDNILGLLTAKYGRHDAYKKEKAKHAKSWGWSRKSGRLMLRLVEVNNLGLCEITYTAAPKGGDNL